ncbi:MAG: hypothetical protein WD989_00680 [Candidatus Paceibacterota bacterium]
MRFQEYYESPEFKGRVFTIDEFAHWYVSKYGGWTYSRDWYGFNIPSKVLEPFRFGKFDPLTEQEKKLLEICLPTGKAGKNVQGDFYVIGVTPNAEYFTETVKHEFVHGAYHVNENYRNDVVRCLADHKIKKIKTGLSKMGYHLDVHDDETNAYILVEPETLSDIATQRDTQKLRTRLDFIFKNHFGFSVLETTVPSLMRQAEHVQV